MQFGTKGRELERNRNKIAEMEVERHSQRGALAVAHFTEAKKFERQVQRPTLAWTLTTGILLF